MQATFLEGPITGRLFRFAMPIALTLIFEQMVNTTDMLVLGHYAGTTAIAAVGNNQPITTLMFSLLVGLSLGTNVTIAQYIGAKKIKEARVAEHTGLLFSLLIGIAFTIGGEILVKPILSWLAVPAAVMPEAELYLRIFMLSLPFVSLYNFEAAIFRATGDGKTPLYSLVIAAVANLGFDMLAVALGFGLAGVVGATVLAYVIDATALAIMFMRRKDFLRLDYHELKICLKELKQIVHIGLPAGIQGMVFSISNLVIQSGINSLGPEAMAASSVALVVEVNVYAFVNAFGQATTTFIGQNFGALQIRRCFMITKKALMVEIAFVFSISAVCCLLAEPLVGFFTTNPAVIAYGAIRIYLATGLQGLNGVIEVLSGSLRGYGYSLPPALAALLSICGTRMLWIATVFAIWPTYLNIMLVYPVSWVITVALLAVIYRRLRQRIIRNYAGRLREELKRNNNLATNVMKKRKLAIG